MRKLKGLGLGLVIGAVVLGVGLAASSAFADSPAVGVGSGSAGVQERATVELQATGIGAPGLGAWSIDIEYDAAVVTAVSCTAVQGGVCNAEYRGNVVRIAGANVNGLEGDTLLATVTFECKKGGSSALEVQLPDVHDATIGEPQPIDAAAQDGSISCAVTPVAPRGIVDAGSGPDAGNAFAWLVAALAAAGLAGLVGYSALRTRGRLV